MRVCKNETVQIFTRLASELYTRNIIRTVILKRSGRGESDLASEYGLVWQSWLPRRVGSTSHNTFANLKHCTISYIITLLKINVDTDTRLTYTCCYKKTVIKLLLVFAFNTENFSWKDYRRIVLPRIFLVFSVVNK